jgi:pimeloyl-ACP methyl ester carboxylesterase
MAGLDDMASKPLPPNSRSLEKPAFEYSQQAQKLSHHSPDDGPVSGSVAVEARFVTPQDPVIVTADGNRLPAVPLAEAHKLNLLKEELEAGGHDESQKEAKDDAKEKTDRRSSSKVVMKPVALPTNEHGKPMQKSAEGSLRRAMPPSHTNPLFPPLPLYGPPSMLRNLQCATFRVTSFVLSLSFLGVIVLGSLFTSLPPFCQSVFYRLTLRNPDAQRPFYEEEMKRKSLRKELEVAWKRNKLNKGHTQSDSEKAADECVPTEGGHDRLICDVQYYARRVGLDAQSLEVQTEDGFIIELWHVYDPKERDRLDETDASHRGPDVFTDSGEMPKTSGRKPKFPVLLMHGLLQSAGAYCVNDDDSLAFYLCKSGYDVWLGNNRCGFKPRHTLLDSSDPRMWCWNIRQMGVFDLPALTSRIIHETGFEKIGLICHSQGTTQTFVALAKEQRPDLGEKLTVFCSLAPAAYAGPLIGKMYFKFMRIISPALFRLVFGIHSFIPFMMTMHSAIHPRIYGWLGYKVFSFLFDWTDTRWDRGLRDRMFQFSPVYVSAESMRWWLGRECFAKHKCILSTREIVKAEEREDEQYDNQRLRKSAQKPSGPLAEKMAQASRRKPRGATAWYNEQAPPFALWVAGNDDLVDGRKLLQRFESGREPHVEVVHSKIIPEYEHLDVIWAMDAVDQVFKEIREVLWKTCNVREICRVPKGCENVEPWVPRAHDSSNEIEKSQSSSSDDID